MRDGWARARYQRGNAMSHLERLHDSFPDVPPMVLLKADLLGLGINRQPAAQNRAWPPSLELPGGVHVFIAFNSNSPYVLVASGVPGADARRQEKRGVEPIAEVTARPRFRWTGSGPRAGRRSRRCSRRAWAARAGHCSCRCRRASSQGRARTAGSAATTAEPPEPPLAPDVDDVREAITEITNEQRTVGDLGVHRRQPVRPRPRSRRLRRVHADRPRDRRHAADDGRGGPGARSRRLVAAAPGGVRLRVLPDGRVGSTAVARGGAGQEPGGRAASTGWGACRTPSEIFGKGRVLCNFVAGVETAVPNVFKTADQAVESTLHGMRWCYTHGITEEFGSGSWPPGPGTAAASRRRSILCAPDGRPAAALPR